MLDERSRSSAWIETYTGKKFFPFDPSPDDVCIRDIAHSLSNQCRYSGHTRCHYSVAQHCVLLSCFVPEELQLPMLLHDASEAYLVDLPAPLKAHRSFRVYREMERLVQDCVWRKFKVFVNVEIEMLISWYDKRIISNERRLLMSESGNEWLDTGEPFGMINEIENICPQTAETLFLNRFERLTKKA